MQATWTETKVAKQTKKGLTNAELRRLQREWDNDPYSKYTPEELKRAGLL